MYKVASDSRQRALHQGRPADWAGGEEVLSGDAKLAQLQDTARLLETRMIAEPNKTKKKQMGLEKLSVQNEIKTLRSTLNMERFRLSGVEGVFVDCAKAILSPVMFRTIMNSAQRELKLRLDGGAKQ